MGLALFSRITTTAWLLTLPRILLRRLTKGDSRVLLLLAPALLTSHRLREGVFPLRGELFIEIFRYIYLLHDLHDVRRYIAVATSLMPAHAYVARRSVHVASTDQSSTPFSGVLFCEASLLHKARNGTCLQGTPDLPNTTVLLYIHGGGFCTGSPIMAAPMFERMVAAFAARSQDPHRRLAVFSLEYGLAPEHPFPHALQQAVHAYLWLLQQGYHSVVIGMQTRSHPPYMYTLSRWRLGWRQPGCGNHAAAAGRVCRERADASWRAAAVPLGGPDLHPPS